jgi:hypothetical protein
MRRRRLPGPAPHRQTIGKGVNEMSKSVTAMPATAANQSAAASELKDHLSDSCIRAASTSAQFASAWSNEAIRFAGRRFARNRETMERFAGCAGWQDLLERQMNWARDILQDYLDESRQFLGLVQEAASGAADAGEAATSEGPAASDRSTSERAANAKHATA